MISLGLSARDRRTLIVGGGLIGALFLLGRGVPWLTRWQSTQIAEAATLTADLASAREGQRLMPSVRDTLRARQAKLAALDSLIFVAPSASAAAANLASALEDLATESSVKINALQLIADSSVAGSLTQVAVRMTGTSDIYGLLALAHAIEGGEQLLAVRDLAVTAADPAAPSNKVETLRIDITVVALARVATERR